MWQITYSQNPDGAQFHYKSKAMRSLNCARLREFFKNFTVRNTGNTYQKIKTTAVEFSHFQAAKIIYHLQIAQQFLFECAFKRYYCEYKSISVEKMNSEEVESCVRKNITWTQLPPSAKQVYRTMNNEHIFTFTS